MDTQSILNELRRTRLALVRWNQYVHFSPRGAAASAKRLPLDPEHCGFGKWFYAQGEELLGNLPHFHSLRENHGRLRDILANIHQHLSSDEIDRAHQQRKHYTQTFQQVVDTMMALEASLAGRHVGAAA